MLDKEVLGKLLVQLTHQPHKLLLHQRRLNILLSLLMKLLSQPMLALLLDQDQRVGGLLLAGPYGVYGFVCLA